MCNGSFHSVSPSNQPCNQEPIHSCSPSPLTLTLTRALKNYQLWSSVSTEVRGGKQKPAAITKTLGQEDFWKEEFSGDHRLALSCVRSYAGER